MIQKQLRYKQRLYKSGIFRIIEWGPKFDNHCVFRGVKGHPYYYLFAFSKQDANKKLVEEQMSENSQNL